MFIMWCANNGLECNTKKCCVICFGKSNEIDHLYTLGDQQHERVNTVKDLDIIILNMLG